MPRPHFALRAFLVLVLEVGCFLGGIGFEGERRRHEEEVELQQAGIYLNANGQPARPGGPVVEFRH